MQLVDDAAHCQRCPLYRNATQTGFGEGPIDAALLLVGEQPGDQEDREGRPFVGPAGRILDLALEKAGLDRRSIYVTNAVKHFKHEQRGKRRLHKHPNRDEVEKCRWWLDQELVLVKPRLVIALGALAGAAPSPATPSAGRKIAAGRQGDEYQPLIPGGAAPARMVHEAWIGAGSVTFITVDGPWDVNWVEGAPTVADLTP